MFSYNWKEDQKNDDQIEKQDQEDHHNHLQLGFRGLSNQNWKEAHQGYHQIEEQNQGDHHNHM
jgi:hypothetical protein